MRKPKNKKLCEWCMERPVMSGQGQIKSCRQCAGRARDRYLQGHPQYRAFNRLFDMKLRLYKDALTAFIDAVVATSDQRWEWALQDHPDKMRRLGLINHERRRYYTRRAV